MTSFMTQTFHELDGLFMKLPVLTGFSNSASPPWKRNIKTDMKEMCLQEGRFWGGGGGWANARWIG
jgi:hypothetical protein